MYKKLFALFMILSVAVLFTGCSNSNSFDGVKRVVINDECISGKDYSATVELRDNESNLLNAEVITCRDWKIIVTSKKNPDLSVTFTAADNNTNDYLNIKNVEPGKCEVTLTAKGEAKVGLHTYEDVKVDIVEFRYTINGIEYSFPR